MGRVLVDLYNLIPIPQNKLNPTCEHESPPLNEANQLVQAWVQEH